MKVFLKSKRNSYDAIGEYQPLEKRFIIRKGSTVSENIAYSATFRAAKNIEKQRKDVIKNNKVIKDVIFKSPSTAANFVTGRSTNGLIAWKDENGKKLKELLKDE